MCPAKIQISLRIRTTNPPPHPPVVYSTDRSKAAVPVLVLLFFALGFILRGDLLCFTLCYFVLVFFSPFSFAITSLGEQRTNLSAFRMFVRFALVWFCQFPLPFGVWEGLRFVIVALPGLFSFFFFFYTGRFYDSQGRKVSFGRERRLWSGYADSQADLSSLGVHVRRYIYTCCDSVALNFRGFINPLKFKATESQRVNVPSD